MPALRARYPTSKFLKFLSTSYLYSSIVLSFDRSTTTHLVSQSGNNSLISASLVSIFYLFLDTMHILKPCAANSWHIAKPIPSEPPVTTAQTPLYPSPYIFSKFYLPLQQQKVVKQTKNYKTITNTIIAPMPANTKTAVSAFYPVGYHINIVQL